MGLSETVKVKPCPLMSRKPTVCNLNPLSVDLRCLKLFPAGIFVLTHGGRRNLKE